MFGVCFKELFVMLSNVLLIRLAAVLQLLWRRAFLLKALQLSGNDCKVRTTQKRSYFEVWSHYNVVIVPYLTQPRWRLLFVFITAGSVA